MPSIAQTEHFIKDVWASNLEEEFRRIRLIVTKYKYVAIDTEFPGVVAWPIGEFHNKAEYQYQLLRCNVDLLKIIQIGLTFMDEKGNTSTPVSTWQFNFKFSLSEDMYAQESINLLQISGIQFKKHEKDGIDILTFAELLMTSGIVLSDEVFWLSFHSRFDFGYLLKVLTNCPLPEEEEGFFALIKLYCHNVYDIKYLTKSCRNLEGGLQEVAEKLEILRIGPQHQVGSDSLLTGAAFFKIREMFFEDTIDAARYCGHLYGLTTPCVQNEIGYDTNSFMDNFHSSSPTLSVGNSRPKNSTNDVSLSNQVSTS